MKRLFPLLAAAALALPAAAANQTVTFITGTIDSLEAEIFAPCAGWKLYALDPYGKRLCEIPEGPNACFNVDGTHPSANFELTRP